MMFNPPPTCSTQLTTFYPACEHMIKLDEEREKLRMANDLITCLVGLLEGYGYDVTVGVTEYGGVMASSIARKES